MIQSVNPFAPTLVQPEREFRGPGCTDACRVVRVLQPGVYGRSEILKHDPEAHEDYGRRLANPTANGRDLVVTGPLEIDLDRIEVTVDGRPIWLSPTEIKILFCLARNLGATVPHPVLHRAVWGAEEWAPGSQHHCARVSVSRLRGSLGPAAALIQTHSWAGYRLLAIAPGAPVPPSDPRAVTLQRQGRWSLRYDRCRVCQETSLRHEARGYCRRCYRRLRESGAFGGGNREARRGR